jgi:hypothetical protein
MADKSSDLVQGTLVVCEDEAALSDSKLGRHAILASLRV